METSNLGIGSRIDHPHFGKGVIVDTATEFYIIWFKSQQGVKSISKEFEIKVIDGTEAVTSNEPISIADIEHALSNVLERRLHETQIVPMAMKWNRGTMVLKPGDATMQQKELPIETFFHKIVMVRDRLRLIEQKINAHKVLTDEEKVEMQQYVTAVYGSLTTFNVLFREPHHQFKGQAGKD